MDSFIRALDTCFWNQSLHMYSADWVSKAEHADSNVTPKMHDFCFRNIYGYIHIFHVHAYHIWWQWGYHINNLHNIYVMNVNNKTNVNYCCKGYFMRWYLRTHFFLFSHANSPWSILLISGSHYVKSIPYHAYDHSNLYAKYISILAYHNLYLQCWKPRLAWT